MMRTNHAERDRVLTNERTYEGAAAATLSVEQQLRRSVMACMLWENTFYEDGEEIGARIVRLAKELEPWQVTALAIEARDSMHLRHVPLLLLSVAAETGRGRGKQSGEPLVITGVADAIAYTIQRADELTEFLAVHAKRCGVSMNKIKPILSAQIKKGLARALFKFDRHQLGKYHRNA